MVRGAVGLAEVCDACELAIKAAVVGETLGHLLSELGVGARAKNQVVYKFAPYLRLNRPVRWDGDFVEQHSKEKEKLLGHKEALVSIVHGMRITGTTAKPVDELEAVQQ